MKPYHESYFSDNPTPPISQTQSAPPLHTSSQSSSSSAEMLPVEGLAASLHARILNNQSGNGKNETQISARRYANLIH